MRRLFSFEASALLFATLNLALALPASATEMLVDRGLPTANLNNASGSDRANVSWADSESSSSPSEYWLPGDSFSIGGSGTYQVTDIRVWEVAAGTTAPGILPAGQSLLGGLASDSTFSQINSGYTVTSVTYGGGSTYQGAAGNSYWSIYQLDFSVNLTLQAGQTYDFFLNSPFVAGDTSGTIFYNAFLHASNAALSGSPQDGSDNTFLWLDVNGASQIVGTWDSNGSGWDKSSDANVQVFGVSTPDAANTLFLLGLGFVGLAVFSFRLNRPALAK